MAQQIINTGAVANDGTGDPLRTAFTETNNNFTEIYTAGPVDSNVRITDNTILTLNTNGNLVLAPNGTGRVVANVDIVPNTANVRNLGGSARRWSTLYLQYADISNTVTIGGGLTVGGNLTVSGNIIQVGNIITDSLTIQLGNTAANASAANGAGITVGANDNIATMLYSSTGNAWNMNIGLNTPNLVVNNISSDDSTFVTVQDGLDVQGDITAETVSTSGNITANYFIGNGSQLTGITSSYGNANVATFLAAFGSNTISTSGNVTAGNILPAGYVSATGNVRGANFNTVGTVSATGNISGNYFIGNGSQLTGLSTNSISNGNSNVNIATSNGPVTVSYAGSGNTWTFGDVNVPEALYWPDGSFQATAFVGIAQDLANPGNATITSNSTGNTTYVWTFGDDGRLTFPGTPRIDTDANNFEVQAAENISFEANAVVNIYTDTSGTTYQWQFGDDGNLTLPGGGSIIVDGSDGVIGPDGDNMVISWDNEDLILRSLGSDVDVEADRDFNIRVNYDGGATDYLTKWVFGQDNEIINITGNSAIITEAGNLNLQGGRNTLSSGNVQITAVDNGVAVNTWTFDNTGNLTAPGNVIFADNYVYRGNTFTSPETNGTLKNFKWEFSDLSYGADTVTLQWNLLDTTFPQWYLTTNSQGNTYVFDGDAKTIGFLDNSVNSGTLTFGTAANNGAGNSNDIELTTVTGNAYVRTGSNSWKFGNTGNLTAPGNITTTGNITGNYIIGDGSQLTNISGTIANVVANVITFNTAAAVSVAPGQMAWNSSDGTVDIGIGYGNVVLQTGQETHYVVRNDTGNVIENGTSVYCSGVTAGSGRIEVSPFTANGSISPVQFLGLATQDINNGVNGVVTWFGYVRGLDTRGTANTAISVGDETWAVGDKLYAHPTAAGKLTNVVPEAPNAKICVCVIITRNQNSGILFVRPTTNLDITDHSDVQITTPAANEFLTYAGNRWENTALDISVDTSPTLGGNLAGAGFSISNIGNITTTGNISGNTAGYAIGYRDIPQVAFTGNATIATTDAGKHYYSTLSTGNVLTIANNASQGFQIGTAISIVNQGTGNITVAQGSGVTLYMAGNATSGNRSIATFGMATLMKVATDTWFINGTGVS